MSQADEAASEVGDFKQVLSTSINGQLPLLVGGHAVNLWAEVYRERIGPELERWLPLTSKDLDLFGTTDLLDALKKEFGGAVRLSGPRSPVVGQLVVSFGGIDRKIDVLRDVVGLGFRELSSESMIVGMAIDGEIYRIRVLPIITLLQAKIANLAKLDQTTRNDFKHVSIMLLIVREYLCEVVSTAESGILDSRAAIGQLEHFRRVISTPESLKCATEHGIRFDGVWPRDLLTSAKDSRIQNFVKHRLPA